MSGVNKFWTCDTQQLLQEIDQKMRRIESILQSISKFSACEEKEEIHQMLLEVAQLLLLLQQNPKVTPLAKGLGLQLQNIQKHFNQTFSRDGSK